MATNNFTVSVDDEEMKCRKLKLLFCYINDTNIDVPIPAHLHFNFLRFLVQILQ